ncbi:hypothetical protein BDK92_1000 [Micromonospora pisi]|uniref:Uncharacterized protein n=1 Tax=Micromonospora pisi TaxID=589240 RepID=A0A495JCT6_9ACTN|nr:hypothetical protein [Micromonospora pisi]RKR86735.1 hypothetical protein BDK92_1000 [Micromonospora pisi]
MSVIGGDTDLVRSDKLEPAALLMKRVDDDFTGVTDANMPPGHIRTSTDEQIFKNLNDGVEVVKIILKGVRALAEGDTENVTMLNKVIANVSDTTTGLADQVVGGHNRPIRP